MKSADKVSLSASSSESDDDEEKIRLAQALDPDFIKNVRKTSGGQLGNSNGFTKGGGGDSEGAPVSKRSKLFDPSANDTEFVKPYSLDVTPEGQRFIAKQLAKSLEKSIKEKPLLTPSSSSTASNDKDADSGIKLFASSSSRLTQSDLLPSQPPKRQRLSSKKKKKKHKKKSSNKSSSSSSDSSSDSEEKLRSVAVSSDWVLQQK